MKLIYLLPGQWVVPYEPAEITTILGSCVAVCLFDRVRRIGGMNHFLLPSGGALFRERSRYGDSAGEDMLQCFLASGSRSTDLEAWVLGGASVGAAGLSGEGVPLGTRNAEAARSVLRSHGIAIRQEDTGGFSARRLRFQSALGILEVRRIDGVAPTGPTTLPVQSSPVPAHDRARGEAV